MFVYMYFMCLELWWPDGTFTSEIPQPLFTIIYVSMYRSNPYNIALWETPTKNEPANCISERTVPCADKVL